MTGDIVGGFNEMESSIDVWFVEESGTRVRFSSVDDLSNTK